MRLQSIESLIGNTPLVALKKLPGDTTNRILVKLEGNNPGGSVKDRPALNMLVQAELRGSIKPGDALIEATSGNTGIALAMVAAAKGYKMILIMPDNMSEERKAAMAAYGAEHDIIDKLMAYKRGETVGAQSALMWPQAKGLTDGQIGVIGVFVQEGFPES